MQLRVASFLYPMYSVCVCILCLLVRLHFVNVGEAFGILRKPRKQVEIFETTPDTSRACQGAEGSKQTLPSSLKDDMFLHCRMMPKAGRVGEVVTLREGHGRRRGAFAAWAQDPEQLLGEGEGAGARASSRELWGLWVPPQIRAQEEEQGHKAGAFLAM